MIKGMTGFGSSEVSWQKAKGVVEIKSQNHRYFDIVQYLPPGFNAIEDKIKNLLGEEIKRGRITVIVKLSNRQNATYAFNTSVIKEYLSKARMLKKHCGLTNNLSLADLVGLPGVVESKETVLDPFQIWPTIEKALKRALRSLVVMREREGKSLRAEMAAFLNRMKNQIRTIDKRKTKILQEKKKTLSDEEFVSFQKSSDVNEELSRLMHYVDEFSLLLNANDPVGKKLDFVAQEMQRETNTIGSKVQDKIVSGAVIALKSKIEKLREQAQNIE